MVLVFHLSVIEHLQASEVAVRTLITLAEEQNCGDVRAEAGGAEAGPAEAEKKRERDRSLERCLIVHCTVNTALMGYNINRFAADK